MCLLRTKWSSSSWNVTCSRPLYWKMITWHITKALDMQNITAVLLLIYLLQINIIRLHIGKLIKFDSMCITLKGKHVHNGRQTKYRWTGEHKNKWGDNSHGIWLWELDTYRHVKTNTYSWPNLQSIIYVVHDDTNEPVLVNI